VEDLTGRFNTLQEEVKAAVDGLTNRVDQLERGAESRDQILEKLQSDLEEADGKLENINKYLRRTNIEINGIPYQNSENIIEILGRIGELVGCPILESDIDAAHRVPTWVPNKIQPIIVKFAQRNKKTELLSRRP